MSSSWFTQKTPPTASYLEVMSGNMWQGCCSHCIEGAPHYGQPPIRHFRAGWVLKPFSPRYKAAAILRRPPTFVLSHQRCCQGMGDCSYCAKRSSPSALPHWGDIRGHGVGNAGEGNSSCGRRDPALGLCIFCYISFQCKQNNNAELYLGISSYSCDTKWGWRKISLTSESLFCSLLSATVREAVEITENIPTTNLSMLQPLLQLFQIIISLQYRA